MFTIILLVLGGYLVWTGSLPLGRFPYISRSHITGATAWDSRSAIFYRIAGALIIIAFLIPSSVTKVWYGHAILFGAAILTIIVAIIVSISGRAL